MKKGKKVIHKKSVNRQQVILLSSTIIVLLLIIGLIIAVININKANNQDNKIKNASALNENTTIDGLAFSDVDMKKSDEGDILTVKLTNSTKETMDLEAVSVVFYDDKDKEVADVLCQTETLLDPDHYSYATVIVDFDLDTVKKLEYKVKVRDEE